MNILVLNGSPAGKDSITLQTVHYLEACGLMEKPEILHVGQQIRSIEKDFQEAEQLLGKADLILFCYPVYTFIVPAQLHRFIELIKEKELDLSGKYAVQITTSKHFYDMTAHRFIEDNCLDLGLKYAGGLSADMEDLLTEKGQKEAREFWKYTVWKIQQGIPDPVRPEIKEPVRYRASDNIVNEMNKQGTVAVVYDDDPDHPNAYLQSMISRFTASVNMAVTRINLRTFPFAGGCLGCFHCAVDGTCIYKDGFDDYLRTNINSADAIVYAFTIKDHSMGSRFKMYDDRQFCNGHRTVTMGKPVGYLIDGSPAEEENLRTIMESRAQVGGNFLAGIVDDASQPDKAIDRLAATIEYAVRNHYEQPKNFYGTGGLKIFRDLIWQMQGLMKEDHRFYKEHGFYDDFPQKHKGRVAAMYLVSALMNSKAVKKKGAVNMTQGMLMPYRAVIEKARK
ncbi:MAG: NAD(P)H-dependent oxidoreductase [Solobacterium sp.]|nr:iron-sulfur protein [Erysipelotrichaceae bacterium]MBQ1446884.1 NAD(P)H-dependent oxidoreductase [Solobacterium sp.]